MGSVAQFLKRIFSRLRKLTPDDAVMLDEHEAAYRRILDLQDRFDRLLTHYGLDDLVDTFHEVSNDQNFLLLVPLIEAQKKELEELRSLVIWGDSDTRG